MNTNLTLVFLYQKCFSVPKMSTFWSLYKTSFGVFGTSKLGLMVFGAAEFKSDIYFIK